MNRALAWVQAHGLLWVIGGAPLAWLVYATAADLLGANPAQALVRQTGDWTLRLLCLTLAVTPMRVSWGWTALARWRRTTGLLTYGYAVLHLLSYAWFDMGLELDDMAHDIVKRPFILVGFVAWCLLTLLAATSFNRAVRWLGGVRWQQLHRSVYGVAVLAVLHFFWMRSAKNNLLEVLIYGGVLAGLLAWRVQHRWRIRRLRTF